MKRFLIILLFFLLLAGGCSKEAAEPPQVNGQVEADKGESDEEASNDKQEVIEEERDQEPAGDEAPVIEETPALEESPIISGPDTSQEPAAEEDSADEEAVRGETPQEAEEGLEDENNILKIRGLVENELKLSMDDLKAMKDIAFEADFYWLNSYGTTGYTHFKGLKLWDLLETQALIKPEAAIVTIRAQDGYSMEFTPDQIKMEYMDETNPDNKYPMIIAWEENGQEYSPDEGAPYKLVVGQKEAGDVNKPQWVSNIDVILVE